MASRLTPPSSCTLFFNWHKCSQKVFMRIFQVGSLSLFLLLAGSLPAVSQAVSQDVQPAAPPATVTTAAPALQGAEALSSPPPATFNDVMDRVVQREHLFLAQMRHMH